MAESLRAKIAAGGAVAGSFVNMDSPALIEVLALSGVDFVVVDCEHSAVTPLAAEHHYRTAEAHGIPVLTRIGENVPQLVQKYLDAGSQGVQMPLVNTAAEAKRVVDAVKYPPLGKRGLAAVRVNQFGMKGPMADYVARANANTLVVVQLETLEAIANADEIVAVDGVDVVFLGPMDLSVALGLTGQVKHAKVLETIERLARKAEAAGKVAGTIARNVDDYTYWRERGVRYLLTGVTNLLAEAAGRFASTIKTAEAAWVTVRGPARR